MFVSIVISANFEICICSVVTKSEERWPKHGQHQGIGILCSRRIFGSPGCRPRCWCKGNGRIAPSASSDIWSLNWRSPFDGAVPASAAGSCHWVDGTSSRSPIGRYFSRKCQRTAAGRSRRPRPVKLSSVCRATTRRRGERVSLPNFWRRRPQVIYMIYKIFNLPFAEESNAGMIILDLHVERVLYVYKETIDQREWHLDPMAVIKELQNVGMRLVACVVRQNNITFPIDPLNSFVDSQEPTFAVAPPAHDPYFLWVINSIFSKSKWLIIGCVLEVGYRCRVCALLWFQRRPSTRRPSDYGESKRCKPD